MAIIWEERLTRMTQTEYHLYMVPVRLLFFKIVQHDQLLGYEISFIGHRQYFAIKYNKTGNIREYNM